VAGSIHGVVLLSGEFFKHDRRQAGLKHGLQRFLQIGVPAPGADLTVAHCPVPGALQIPGDPALPVTPGHQIERFNKSHRDGVLAVGRGQAQLQANRIFFHQAKPKTGGQFEALDHCGNDACSLIHSGDPCRLQSSNLFSAGFSGCWGFVIVTTEAHGQKIFFRDSPFTVKKFGVNGDLAGAVAGSVAWPRADGITGSTKTFAHDAECLPKQGHEQGSVEKGKQRTQHDPPIQLILCILTLEGSRLHAVIALTRFMAAFASALRSVEAADRSAAVMTFQPRSLVASALAGGLLVAGVSATPLLVGPQEAEARPVIGRDSFVAAAVKRSGPAVVTLETARTFNNQSNAAGVPPSLMRDPLFRHFFGIPRSAVPRPHVQRGQGSGVIFDAKGLLLTNAHVVEGADQLTVGLSDGRRVPAWVVGKDSLTDLAVVRLEGSGPWPVAALGNSDQLSVGDWAIAVGNPYGLESTVTLGIISNLNRNVAQLGISGKRLDLIQTDAAINPGNSGGPLLNADGEVIGINTLVRSGPGAGLGFAIPINRASTIAEQLMTRGKARHPVIGIGLSPVPRPTPTSPVPPGAVIRSVQPGGPADRAGLKVDDVITRFDGQAVADPASVVSAIERRGVDSTVVLGVQRGQDKITIEVKPVDLSALAPS